MKAFSQTIRYTVIVLGILFFSLLGKGIFSAADVSAAPLALGVGGCAEVYGSNSSGGLRVRSGPGSGYSQVGSLYDGTKVRITGGPTNANGYTWWQHDRGGWSAGNWLRDTSCSSGSGNIQLVDGLRFSPSSPQVNQSTNAYFKAKNNGSASITLEYLGVKCRRNSDDANFDYFWHTNVTLSPGQEFNYDANRSFDRNGSYWCTANYRQGGNWNDVKWSNGSTNYVTVNVQSAPTPTPVPPGRLILIQDLSISNSNPGVGEDIAGSFRVKNVGGQAITLEYLGIQGRLNGDVNSTGRDFNWVQNLTLQPGQEYPYSSNRNFDIAGNWTLRPNYKQQGRDWSDVHRDNGTVNTVWITVKAPTPGKLVLIQDLSVSNTSPNINHDINASYKVKNIGGQPITLDFLGVQGRLNGDINGTAADFYWFENLTLQPGQEHPYSSNRSFGTTGRWSLRPNYKLKGGGWSDVHRENGTVNTVWITVQEPPPPTPAKLEITTGLVLSPVNPQPGQSVHARVIVRNVGESAFRASRFGVKGRYTAGDLDYSFDWRSDFTLNPGDSYEYNSDRAFDRTGNYWFTANYQDTQGNWRDVKWPNGTTNYVNINVGAPPPPTDCYTVTTAVTPSGSGAIQKEAGNCNQGQGYLAGTVLRLTATPASGYAFAGWSGGIAGTSNPAFLTIRGNVSVVASFGQASANCYTLTLDPGPGGAISPLVSPNCGAGQYASGTTVQLQAIPESGYKFTSWAGVDGTGGSGIANVVMNRNRTVSATFHSTETGGTEPIVVLVHGIMTFAKSWDSCNDQSKPLGPYPKDWQGDGSDYFTDLVQWLKPHFDVYQVHVSTTPLYTPLLQDNGACLEKQMDTIVAKAQGRDIFLVAHSMGGLVSRAYLNRLSDGELRERRIRALYTFGSPHAGVNTGVLLKYLLKGNPTTSGGLAVLCKFHPGLCQFSTEQIGIFNLKHPNRGQVDYTFVGGDSSQASLSILGWLLTKALWPLDGSNDGIVGKYSSIGKAYTPGCLLGCWDIVRGDARTFWTGETHTSDFGTPGYFKPHKDAKTRSYECLIVWLTGKGNCSALSAFSQVQISEEPSVSDPIVSFLPSEQGVIQSEQQVTHTVQIDNVTTAAFQLSWITGTLGLTIETPDGQSITPAWAASHPSQAAYVFAPATEFSVASASYVLTQPVPGPYTLRVQAGQLGSEGTNYALTSLVESTLRLDVTTDRTQYPIGSTAQITATLQDAGAGVEDTAVQARLYRSDSVVDTVVLTPQGNGVYAGAYPIPAVPGYLGLTVTAEGELGGNRYVRQSERLLAVLSASIEANQQLSAVPIDDDGNGRFDRLSVAVGVNTTQAQVLGRTSESNEYLISADLVDNAGQLIDHASTIYDPVLQVGSPVISFSGDAIRQHGVSGPYSVTNVLILDAKTGLPTALPMDVGWATEAYDAESFAETCFVLSVTSSAGGTVDVNPEPNCNDGLQYVTGTEITLTATAETNFRFDGWNDDVTQADSQVILTVEQDTHVSAQFGPETVNFIWPGVIGWTLVSPPFTLEDNRVEAVLSPVSGQVGLLFAYQGCDTTDPWKKYDPAAPSFANDLTTIDSTAGYWLQRTSGVPLAISGTVSDSPAISLCVGWNLVGFPSLQPTPITEALHSIEGCYAIVYTYDAQDSADPWKKYDPAAPAFANDLSEMKPGFGYWIRATTQCVWEP